MARPARAGKARVRIRLAKRTSIRYETGMRQVLTACLLLLAAGAAVAEENPLLVDIGTEQEGIECGYGWGYPEHDGERSFAWIRQVEADLWIDIEQPAAAMFEMSAVPYYLPKKFQRIGLYINNRFITEWDCPHLYAWQFGTYRGAVPSDVFVRGRNRITLRLGYLADADGREYALAVDYLKFVFAVADPAADGGQQ